MHSLLMPHTLKSVPTPPSIFATFLGTPLQVKQWSNMLACNLLEWILPKQTLSNRDNLYTMDKQ